MPSWNWRGARRARVATVACALLAGGLAGRARADGAFPDSLSVLVPADQPRRITLATNFGLISSNDAGASWAWTCEGQLTSCSMLYTLSAAPADRLFALSADSLVYSDDGACDWSVASGAVSGGGVVDAFPLAQDPRRVLAVVSPNGVGAQTAYTVVASNDGGRRSTRSSTRRPRATSSRAPRRRAPTRARSTSPWPRRTASRRCWP